MARFTCHDPHNIYDIIPCDLVASNILVCACALSQVAACPLVFVSPLLQPREKSYCSKARM